MANITAAMCAWGRTLAEPRSGPGGGQISFVASAGRSHLVVVDLADGVERVVSAEPLPRAHAMGGGVHDWLPDGGAVIAVRSGEGLWRLPVEGGAAAQVVAGTTEAPAVSPTGDRVAYVADGRHVAVAPLREDRGWPVLVSSGTTDFVFDPVWSPDGEGLAWLEWDVPAMPWDEGRIVVARPDGSERRSVAGGPGVGVQQPRFSPDGSRLGFLSDATGWLQVWMAAADGSAAQPVIEEAFEHGNPPWGQGQRSWCWSPDGSQIAFVRNEGGFGRLCRVEVGTGAVAEVAKGVHAGVSWGAGGILALRTGARTPDQIVLHDPSTEGGAGRRIVAIGPVAFPRSALREPEVVSWPAGDGTEIHGRLHRPAEANTAPPMLVWIHGGPTDQQQVVFSPRISYFVDRGWAVLVPDHRGSSGWGRAYTQAMAGRWGDLDVADSAAGVRAAIDGGWADPRRIVAIGASAGGFTVLGLLAHHPELFAAGVDLFGVADLLQLDETTHRFEAHYLHSIVGPLPGGADRYRERSPVTFASEIDVPVLILQGTDDEVVPPAQSCAVADGIRAGGGTVELHLYEGAGHGFSRPEDVEDHLERIDDFLRRHVLRWRSPG